MNTNAAPQGAQPDTKVAIFQPPRLPHHPDIKKLFNIEPPAWKALTDAVFPTAKTHDAILLALSYCKARDLDVFKRPVHIVPMWDSKKNGYVETIWPGISELRTTAFRTGNYAGSDEAEFGPLVEHNFRGRVQVWKGGQKAWEDKEVTVRAPEWCRVTVYRDLHGRLCKFVGPKVIWLEAYATIGKSELPNDMWQSRPEGQLEKCAEAAALRKAFPEELGNELSAEEMAGRQITQDVDAGLVRERMTNTTAPAAEGPAPDAVKGGRDQPQQQASEPGPNEGEIVVEGEIVEDENLTPTQQAQRQASAEQQQASQQPDGLTGREKEWLRNLNGAFSGCEDLESFGKKQRELMAPEKNNVSKQAWAKAQQYAEDTYRRIADQ